MNSRKDRVLIVEADASVRDSCVSAVESLNLPVYSTAYIDDFEIVLAQLKPTLIVLDLNMLSRGGSDLLDFLVDSQSTTSVLLLSGSDQRVESAAKVLAVSVGLANVAVMKRPTDNLQLQCRLKRRLSALSNATRPQLHVVQSVGHGRTFGKMVQTDH